MNDDYKVGAVILAAGESSRMGKNKLLMDIQGKEVIERVRDEVSKAVEHYLFVLGDNPPKNIPKLKEMNEDWIVNEEYSHGMTWSFVKGLKALKDQHKDLDSVMLVLGDQPLVDGDFLCKMVEKWEEDSGIVSPIHNGKKGHPVLFDRKYFDEILSLPKDGIIRDVIHNNDDELHLLEAPKWSIMDMDTPEDYERVKEYADNNL